MQLNLHQITKCQKCPLFKTRVQVVVGRGPLTATTLVIGEAPGEAEDVLGQAFIGPSGKLLDDMLIKAKINNCFFTNTILCRPIDNREPLPAEIFLCLDNILKIINSSPLLHKERG